MESTLKVLLIKPRARLRTVLGLQGFQLLEPLELGYLAAAVPAPHVVQVLDLRLCRFPVRALVRRLERLAPEVVGITGYSHEAAEMTAIARTIRRVAPRARVIVGGHHATAVPHDFDRPEIDAVVRGEGCGPFAAIVAATSRREPLAGLPGVLVPGRDSFSNDAWPVFPDPATLPVPRHDLWDARDYRSVWACETMEPWQRLFFPVSMMRTSFGCRMKCSFCVVPHLFSGCHRPRPVEQVADEIAALPARHVYFSDDENFIDEAFAHAVAEALERRGVRKRYFAWTRSTTVIRSPELFRRWRALGLDAAFLGFEFPTDEELRATRKGATVAANEQAHEMLRSIGVMVHAAFMLRPEYGHAEFARLAGYVRAMPPSECSFTVCTPSPGTEDYQAMRAALWVDRPYELHDCMHPLTPTALPLREFSSLYAEQVHAGLRKIPMRDQTRPVPPGDLLRVVLAERRYVASYRNLYRDYPRELWG